MSNITSGSPPISQAFTSSFNLSGIGILIDRWSNLFPGMAEQVPTVQAQLLLELNEKQLPIKSIRPVKAHMGLASHLTSIAGAGDVRPYIVLENDPGVICAIYVDEYGSDMYASWRTHVKGVFNTRLLWLLAIVSAVPSLCVAPFTILIGAVQQGFGNVFGATNRFDWGGALLPIVLIFAGFFIAGLVLIAFAGYFFHEKFSYYFFVEPNIFDAEDVSALSTAAHQSLLSAINRAGIDITQIEPKKVQSGRRSERLE